MLPHESTYPFFEANQVLKKDDLNNLFEYLDEQNRMTRTNLIGIGIVCGMDVVPSINALKITKGVGVTSEGYLVTVPEKTYSHYKAYPANKNIFLGDDCYSETFKNNKNMLHSYVEGIPANQLLELVEGTPAGSTPLNATFLADKVVLIYVELSKNALKNCSPNSCDDKGTEISVVFRRFLVSKTNADIIKKEASDLLGSQSTIDIEKIINAKFLLPDIRLKRFDVPNTNPVRTSEIVAAYKKILSKSFIENTLRDNLIKIFEAYESILGGLDKTVIQNWAASYDGTGVKLGKPYEYQYFYDFVSDLIQNYHEIRAKGLEVLALCCPDCRMFPRHLFLGEANIDTSKNKSIYRQYFIPSPIIGNQKKLGEQLRSLFERMIGLIKHYEIPQPSKKEVKGKVLDENIRITPSKLGDIALSKKAIPYYYKVNSGTPKLYENWNFNLKNQGKEKQNLSYHADLYNIPVIDFVRNPLEYDLEPFNFLRIEGIVGKPYQEVMAAVNQYIEEQRLPFDIVALSTGNDVLNIEANLADFECHFADLETIYDVQRKELECLLEEFDKDGKLDFIIKLFPKNLSLYTDDIKKHISENIKKIDLPEAVLCKIEIIGSLVKVYNTRLAKLKTEFIFSNYTSKNPGIQHKAGVPMGGTFIIVYHGNIKRTPSRGLTTIEADKLLFELTKASEMAERAKVASEATDSQAVTVKTWSSGSNEIPVYYQKFLEYMELLPEKKRTEFLKDTEKKATDFFDEPQTDEIEVGIVFADFYLPYRCCADCTPVQVVLPTPPPVPLAVTISAPICDESNKNFTVTLTISGGKMPYNIDGEAVTGNTLNLTLKSGSSQNITIKDADGQVVTKDIPVHTCEQPVPLAITISNPKCDESNKNFTVKLTISGGKMPYSVDGTSITGNTKEIITESTKSNTVTVKDADGQVVIKDIPAHTCQQPCNLPCEGIAERCFYPLWITKPPKDFTAQLKGIQSGFIEFEGNSIFDFTTDYKRIFRAYTEANFDAKITELITIINTGIATKLGDDKTLILAYDITKQIISFEHYVCHKFGMNISITESGNLRVFQSKANYNNDGWSIATDDASMEGKKFGCIDIDKCANKQKERCKEPIKFEKIKLILSGGPGEYKYEIKNDSSTDPDSILWFFETEKPQFSSQKSGTFISRLQQVKVRLIFVKGPCFVVINDTAPNQLV